VSLSRNTNLGLYNVGYGARGEMKRCGALRGPQHTARDVDSAIAMLK
jgi:hypothetical protein